MYYLIICTIILSLWSGVEAEQHQANDLAFRVGKFTTSKAHPCDMMLLPIAVSESCKKTKYLLKDQNVRRAFFELWLASKAEGPLRERREQGGWIVYSKRKGYRVIPFPKEWKREICSIELPADFMPYVPKGVVAVVHTHPFYEGEDLKESGVCGELGKKPYQSGGNYSDLFLLSQLANELQDFCIKSYVIDGSNITEMTSWGKLSLHSSELFFGRLASSEYKLINP